jgi:putative intracellular protease/amidase
MTAHLNTTSSRPKRVLMVVSNPAVSTTLGVPVGFWASELFHAYHEFRGVGYEVEVRSPRGGKVEVDSWSDPRDPSRYSAEDVLSLGYLNLPEMQALLAETKSIDGASPDGYDAIMVTGGQGPMFTFPTEVRLHELIAAFYQAEKPTAVICHGTSALLFVKGPDGEPLIRGKTMTGFANSEEDYADAYVGRKVMPFRIEDEARKLGANFVTAGRFRPFAIRDGRLITGQQQYSAREAARLVIEALGV